MSDTPGTTEVAYAYETSTASHMGPLDSNSTEGYVRRYFSDIPELAEVARCESTFRHVDPSTGAVLRGKVNNSDVGVMQINLYYHNETAQKMGLDLMNIDDNMAYARHLYEKQGTQPWSASAPCWQPRLVAMR